MWNRLNNQKRKNKDKMLGVYVVDCISSVQAKILLILPESGPLARAASRFKPGFLATCAVSGQKAQPWRNTNQENIPQLLKLHLSKKPQLLLECLACSNVEQWRHSIAHRKATNFVLRPVFFLACGHSIYRWQANLTGAETCGNN